MSLMAPLTASARRWAWWPVVLLPVLMAVLDATVDPTVFYDPPWLILLGNTLFLGLASFLVAGVAWRNYCSTGRTQVLLLGCAMMVFGLGAVLAAGVRTLADGANSTVTIHNSSALVAALLHAAAGLLLAADLPLEAPAGRRNPVAGRGLWDLGWVRGDPGLGGGPGRAAGVLHPGRRTDSRAPARAGRGDGAVRGVLPGVPGHRKA